MNTASPPQVETQREAAGVLGAGRVGSALTECLLRADAKRRILTWSRRGPGEFRDAVLGAPQVRWADQWHHVLQADCVFAAIPARGLIELALAQPEEAVRFRGRLYCASMDLRLAWLQQVFPIATCVRFAPFLLPKTDSVSSLALRPRALTDAQWNQSMGDLERLGNVDVTLDEAVFERVAVLGSPWPVVLYEGLSRVLVTALQGIDPSKHAKLLGNRVFWRGMGSLAAAAEGGEWTGQPEEKIATPGGLTDRGRGELTRVVNVLEGVFNEIVAHHEALVAAVSTVAGDAKGSRE